MIHAIGHTSIASVSWTVARVRHAPVRPSEYAMEGTGTVLFCVRDRHRTGRAGGDELGAYTSVCADPFHLPAHRLAVASSTT